VVEVRTYSFVLSALFLLGCGQDPIDKFFAAVPATNESHMRNVIGLELRLGVIRD
jgi:hypothetical protein